MEEKKKFIGFYNYTVILTYIGMITGLLGITLVMNEAFYGAALALMISGLCDMFDGAIASTKERSESEKYFGIQIDSLSDLICFGVLPGFFLYKSCGETKLSLMISCFYILCALVRLAYFNVMETERQSVESGRRKVYQGLPVTAIALILPALLILDRIVPIDLITVFRLVMCVTAIAFIIQVKIKKPGRAGKILLVLAGAAEFAVLLASGAGLI